MTNLLEGLTASQTLIFFGLISGALSVCAYLPYIYDTLKGRTQPQRACWLIWSVLSVLSFASLVYEGATASLWFVGVQAAGTVTVCVLSIFWGKGVFLTRIDWFVLAAASVGIGLWFVTESAVYALGISIGVSLLGGTVTVGKAYRAPETETISTWVLSFVAACFAALSVGAFDPVQLAYPAYLFTLNAAIVLAILAGRRRTKPQLRQTKIWAAAALRRG